MAPNGDKPRHFQQRDVPSDTPSEPDVKRLKGGTWAHDNIKPKAAYCIRMFYGPLALMVVPPTTVIVLIFTILKLEGSGSRLFQKISNEGIFNSFADMHPTSGEMFHAMKYVLAFMMLQLLFMPLLPGKMYIGPVAPSGHRPTYKANGIQAYFATILVWAVGSFLGLFNAGVFFEIALPMFAGLNLFSFVFCAFLYLKGRFAPSTRDSGASGNLVFDYFWGTELYPRLGSWLWSVGWDVKQFTNCRFGMMMWGISILSYAAHQYQTLGYVTDAMVVSVLVQASPPHPPPQPNNG